VDCYGGGAGTRLIIELLLKLLRQRWWKPVMVNFFIFIGTARFTFTGMIFGSGNKAVGTEFRGYELFGGKRVDFA
jgi:hypothetical protein